MKVSLTFYCLVAIIATVSAAASQNDYCSMCKGHIGCNHNQLFAESCPKNAKMVTMTDSLKQLLIDGHNEKRNFIAGGGDRKLSPACAMPVMKWDEELAKLAALNVKQCEMRHDSCHDTSMFNSSGQNLYYAGESLGIEFSETKVSKSIDAWYGEIKHVKQTIINTYPEDYNGPVIGHFTVMMNDRNTHLGCAASTYTESGMRIYLVACNYAYTNMVGEPVYSKCNSAATKCAYGRHKQYKNLCAQRD